MNLKERYKTRGKRRIIKFFAFYLFFAFLLIVYSSYSRYTIIEEGTPKAYIASWKVEINNQDITDKQTLTNVIELVPDSTIQTTTDNKLAPGKSGHFDLIINPAETEVAVEYNINFDTTNLPTGIELTRYKIVEDNISENLINSNIVGQINLTNREQALSENDQKTIRVYWEWKEDTVDIPIEGTNYNISVTINLQQKI